jgi:hypothetical protein
MRDIYIEAIKKSHIVSYVIKDIGATLCMYPCIYVCIFNLQGKTPLHVAAFGGDTQMVELLIDIYLSRK